jgi:hypothetical protein
MEDNFPYGLDEDKESEPDSLLESASQGNSIRLPGA